MAVRITQIQSELILRPTVSVHVTQIYVDPLLISIFTIRSTQVHVDIIQSISETLDVSTIFHRKLRTIF
jgi:hypothetical protein